MYEKILKYYDVAITSALANYWKNEAKSKINWPELTQKQGTRETDLFKDPLMEVFVNEQVKTEAEKRLDKRMWLPLGTRTRFFRRTVSEAVHSKAVTQVIILGSGFDTLSVRKAKYSQQLGVRFFEVDQPEVLECKKQLLSAQYLNKNATYIGLDYVKGDLIAELATNKIDFNQPTLILWEGNTFYLEKEEVLNILSNLSSKFSRLIITFDYMHNMMQTNTQQLDSAAKEQCLEKTLNDFASKNAPFKAFFAPEELVTLCKEFGIYCVDHKTAAALAKEYQVDESPYYTAETYSVITFCSK